MQGLVGGGVGFPLPSVPFQFVPSLQLNLLSGTSFLADSHIFCLSEKGGWEGLMLSKTVVVLTIHYKKVF